MPYVQDDAAPRTVLVVDDSEQMRQMVRMVLDMDPRFEVLGEARDGEQALERARELRPDAIVLDFEMPRRNGLETAPELRRELPGVRIVMWSASLDSTDAAYAAGVDAFVDKAEPISTLLTALAASPTERRTRRHEVQVVPGQAATQLVLSLPRHRITPGSTVSFTDHDGCPRRILLPDDVAPGRAIPVPLPDGVAVELVLTLA